MDLLAVQGTLKSLPQHHSSKATILWRSAFFTVQLSHPYMTTGKTVALTRWTFIGKVISLLFNMLSRLFITFLPRSKRLLMQSPCAVTAHESRVSFEGNEHVFPVVMYGCESWTVKKAERQRIDAFELWCWRRLLRVP